LIGHTVSSLQERVRFRCALPAFTANTNVTTADALSLVQESVRKLCGLMAEFNPEAYFATGTTLTTTSGVSTCSLPLNFTKLLTLHWDRGNGWQIPIRLATVEDQWPSDSVYSWENLRPMYRFLGNQLEFYPTPRAVHDVALRYSTGLFPTAAADTVFLELGWDEWVVLDCCCKVRQRQEKGYAEFAGERSTIEQQIRDQARRDRVGVAQTRDVQADNREARALEWWRLP